MEEALSEWKGALGHLPADPRDGLIPVISKLVASLACGIEIISAFWKDGRGCDIHEEDRAIVLTGEMSSSLRTIHSRTVNSHRQSSSSPALSAEVSDDIVARIVLGGRCDGAS